MYGDKNAGGVVLLKPYGGVPESGTAINDVMRPMSRFARRRGGVSRAEAKAQVIECLKAYYERFSDFVTIEYDSSVSI